MMHLLVLAMQLPYSMLLLLEDARIMTFAHFGSDGAGIVEAGVHESVVIRGRGVPARTRAGADEVQTSPARFTGIVATRVAFLDFEATFEARPAHDGGGDAGRGGLRRSRTRQEAMI